MHAFLRKIQQAHLDLQRNNQIENNQNFSNQIERVHNFKTLPIKGQ